MAEAEPNVRASGPVEGDRGNREVPPTNPSAPVDELADVTRQRDEYLDALQRARAEFSNYKKRVARDQENRVARAPGRGV
jgi:molecular chaperone GrpE (heat shock protein)